MTRKLMREFAIDESIRALIPPLTAEERTALEASIKAEGCRDAPVVWVGTDDTIPVLLDGHNRVEICDLLDLPIPKPVERWFPERDEAKLWVIDNQSARRNLTPYQRAELQLHREKIVAAKAKARQGRRTDLLPNSAKGSPIHTRAELARSAGVGQDTMARAKVIAEKAPEEIKQQLRRGDVSINKAYKDIRTSERREERIQSAREMAKSPPPALTGLKTRYPVLYADPPWRYEFAETDSRRIENQYPTMTDEQIAALPVTTIATDSAVLFLWATAPKLPEALHVMQAWGFKYMSHAIWDKEKLGMGYWFRGQHELLLVGSRGEMPPPVPSARVSSVIRAPRGKHSEKPAEVREIIERMFPDLPRLELFARSAVPGWDVWGNEVAA